MKPVNPDSEHLQEDPVPAALGMFKGRGPTTEELLIERRQEREREEALERCFEDLANSASPGRG